MASNQKPVWSNVTQTSSVNWDRIGNEAGALLFSQDSRQDEFGSFIPQDKSSISLVDKFKSCFGLFSGDVFIKANNNITQRAEKNYNLFVNGHTQFQLMGGLDIDARGDVSIKGGTQTDKQVEASRKLNELMDEIGDETIKVINENKDSGDRVACNVCELEMEVDRAALALATIKKYVRKIFNIRPNSPLGGIVEKIEKILSIIVGFFLDSIAVASMNGGSCGCSGCKNNSIASPLYAIQKGNEAAAEKFKQHKNKIEKLEMEIDRSTGGFVFPNDYVIKVGLHLRKCQTVAHGMPLPVITELTDGNPKYCFIPSSKGTCKKAIYSDVAKTTGLFGVTCNELKTEVGSNGVDISSTGKISLKGSWVEIISHAEGEINISTNNKIQLGGANIVLTSKGNPNGDAIILDSDRVYVGGKLSVQGDIALKGSLMMDGSIYTTHLTCPGERVESDISSSAHNVHSAANWNNPVKPDATKMDIFDKIWKTLRDIAAFLIGLVLTPDFLKTKIEETYSTIRINMIIDNFALETGYAWCIQYPARLPLVVIGSCTNGGAVTGTVIPAMMPVYSFTHNHGSPGDPHYHAYTTPQTEPYGSNAAAIAARQPASHIPTPAKQTGMGSKPGHKSFGDLGPCGGGGGFFGNTGRVNSAKLRRNQTYGINSIDAFGGNDFIDTTLSGINVNFNPDGTINPDPKLYISECD